MTIYPTRSPHDWLVASATVPGRCYQTTRHSCTCPGFMRYGKPGWTCKHIRAVRDEHGDAEETTMTMTWAVHYYEIGEPVKTRTFATRPEAARFQTMMAAQASSPATWAS